MFAKGSLGLVDFLYGARAHPKFTTAADVVNDQVQGKTFVITGANSGLGRICAIELAKKGAHVVMLNRSQDKSKAVVDEARKIKKDAKIEYVQVDLSNWTSIKTCIDKIKSKNLAIYALINNAGIMAPPKYQTCANGMEMQMSTNHFGHFMLTRELMPMVIKGAEQHGEARVVVLSSMGHQFGILRQGFGWPQFGFDFDHVNDPTYYSPFWNYGQVGYSPLLLYISRISESSSNLTLIFADQARQHLVHQRTGKTGQ